MPITNPQAVRFANEEVRTVADKATAYYWQGKAFLLEWVAGSLGAVIPDDAGELIVDGSAEDGRGQITGKNANDLKDHLQAMVDDLEANNNLKLNILLKIEVNGSPS